MPVTTTTNKALSVGNGVVKSFPIPFLFYANTHIEVRLIHKTTGAETLQIQGTDYTVTGAGNQQGGAAQFVTAPSSDYNILRRRIVPYTQDVDLKEGDKLPPDTIDRKLDEIVMMAQQLTEVDSRSIKLAAGSALSDIAMPSPGGSKFIRWNSSGTALEAADITGTLNTTVDGVTATAYAGLPAAAQAGRVRYVTDTIRGLYVDNGVRWVHSANRVQNLEVYGADPLGVSDSLAAFQAAHDGLPSAGGVIVIPEGTYTLSDTPSITKPLIIEGQGIDVTIVELTTPAVLRHLFYSDYSLWVRNCTLRVAGAALTADYMCYAIRQDLDGQNLPNRVLAVENVKIRNFNAGVFSDGGLNYCVDRVHYRMLDIQTAGPASDYIGSCMFAGRVNSVEVVQSYLDQNNTGEHALYFFGAKDVRIAGLKVRNATRSEVQAVKIVGDDLGASPSYPFWSVEDLDVESCRHGILFQTFDSEIVRNIRLYNASFKDMTQSVNVIGAVQINPTATSRIHNVDLRGLWFENLAYGGVHVSSAAGGSIDNLSIDNVRALNWSTSSSGTYALLGCVNLGTIRNVDLSNFVCDGNSNGKNIWWWGSFGSQEGPVKCLTERNMYQVGVTDFRAGVSPHEETDNDTAPSLALGDEFIFTNSGATSITTPVNLRHGKVYSFRAGNGNTTFVNGATFVLNGAVNFNPGTNDTLTVRCSGTALYEVARSNN